MRDRQVCGQRRVCGAIVDSPIASCHWATGSWAEMMVAGESLAVEIALGSQIEGF